LAQSARLVELALPCPLVEVEAIVKETLRRNTLDEANIRIIITGGVSVDSISAGERSGLLVLVTPPRQYPAEFYQNGVKAITVEMTRYIPQAKTINYIPAMIALKRAKAVNAIEALYVNSQGHILEGTTTNLFVFKGERLITPVEDILPGVTRNFVFALARPHFDLLEQPVLLSQLGQVNEAFMTASNKEIMPVRMINDQLIGPGKPGPNTRQLMTIFRQATQQ
jgi:branched-chain amino acid aminotransferase